MRATRADVGQLSAAQRAMLPPATPCTRTSSERRQVGWSMTCTYFIAGWPPG